ncbi:hypothetical protein Trydic_g4410 [Trypoxylus dichotomus]
MTSLMTFPILNQLKQITESDITLTLLLLIVIRAILNRSCTSLKNQQPILQTTSNLLRTFLADENTIIKIRTLQLIHEASADSVWHEALRNIITKNAHLQRLMTNFTDRMGFNSSNTLKIYMKLEKVEFQHECLENITLEPVLKKKKIEPTTESSNYKESPKVATIKNVTENIDATRVIQRIRKDVQYLGKLVGKNDLTEQNVKDIDFIMKELQGYL